MFDLREHIIMLMLHLPTKTIFLAEGGNNTHQVYIHFKSIPLSIIGTIAPIHVSLHSLQCEIGRWGTSDETSQLCNFFP